MRNFAIIHAAILGFAVTFAPSRAIEAQEADLAKRVEMLEAQNAELLAQMQELKAMMMANMEVGTDSPTASQARPLPQLTATVTAAPPATSIPTGEPGILARESAETMSIEDRLDLLEGEIWDVDLNPNGGGLEFTSPDEYFRLRLLAYAQAQTTITDAANNNTFEEGDFRVRRARVDWLADFGDQYQLFVELDGAGASGASLVEARLNAKLVDDVLQLRAGKFTTPFSTENFRSSRGIDTVERYIALNSMFSLPALDVQNGLMLWGTVPAGSPRGDFEPSFTYYAGAYNGNSSAGSGGNVRDSNGDKEFQAKLVYNPIEHWTFGTGYDHNTAEEQSLTLSSLSGTPYIRVPGGGVRNGVEADFLWEPGRFSLRGEGLHMEFEGSDLSLTGGFLQAAYFLTGDLSGGFQPVMRVETARLNGSGLSGIDGEGINAVTAGFNWFLNGNVRWQLNYIGEDFDGAGNASIGSPGFRNSVLSQFQIKF